MEVNHNEEWEDVDDETLIAWDEATRLKYLIMRDRYHYHYALDELKDIYIATWFHDRSEENLVLLKELNMREMEVGK